MPRRSAKSVRLLALALLLGYWLPQLQSLRAADARAPAADDPLAFHAEIAPLLAKHCTSCHRQQKQENGVNFAIFSDVASILGRRELWTKARAALQSEEMPPDPEETHFTADDRRQLIQWIENRIEKIDRLESDLPRSGTAVGAAANPR